MVIWGSSVGTSDIGADGRHRHICRNVTAFSYRYTFAKVLWTSLVSKSCILQIKPCSSFWMTVSFGERADHRDAKCVPSL